MARLIFRYLTGSKANQIEQVPLEGVIEMMIGRDPSAAIVFDPEKDDLVSRQHAVIKVKDPIAPTFSITDLHSTNGTFVNGEPLVGERDLFPEDVIEFGHGGPKMVFDVEPRPAGMRTRSGGGLNETRMSDGVPPPITSVGGGARATTVGSGSTVVPPKVAIGRATLEHELAKERKAAGRKWMIGAAAALVVVGLVGGLLFFRDLRTEQAMKDQVAAAEKKAEASVAAVKDDVAAAAKKAEESVAAVKTQVDVMTPAQIADTYRQAVVFVESSWSLYNKNNAEQVFQKYVGGPSFLFETKEGKWVTKPPHPAYIALPNGELVRWLVTESEDLRNDAIGIASQGSGFVVTKDGSILTNKHVAAGWLMPWTQDFEKGTGIKFDLNKPNLISFKRIQGKDVAIIRKDVYSEFDIADAARNGLIREWVPGTDAPIFPIDSSMPRQIGAFETKNELTMTFPGNKLGVTGRFLRASQENDAALIKIDVPGGSDLEPVVKLAPAKYLPPLGESVTVMGYPALSGERSAETKSKELMGAAAPVVAVVPEPTLSKGNVAKVFEKEAPGAEATGVKIRGKGDYYELTVNTSGPGNSGGPVFNGRGDVIGIFTYTLAGGRVSGAVPIKYGQDLLQLTRVTDR